MRKFFSLFCLLMSTQAFGGGCPDISHQSFYNLTQALSEGKKIIFFASWCEGCKEKIQNAKPGHSILVGVFDSKDNIDRSYQFLGSSLPCFYGGENAETHFKVKYLPYEITKNSNKS